MNYFCQSFITIILFLMMKYTSIYDSLYKDPMYETPPPPPKCGGVVG
jgi:hypothetical protein